MAVASGGTAAVAEYLAGKILRDFQCGGGMVGSVDLKDIACDTDSGWEF